MAPDDDQWAKLDRLKAMGLEELIAMHLSGEPGFRRDETERELDRRQLEASRDLRLALLSFKASADKSAVWMVRLTIVIAGLTVAIAALTLATLLRAG